MANMLISSRIFPNRAEVPNALSGSVPVPPVSQLTLDAPPRIDVVNQGQPPESYAFLFWHIGRALDRDHVVTFNAPSDASNFFATAWYQKTLVGGPPVPPHISTIAFSLDKDDLIADTPISIVTPAAAWQGPPSTQVSTTLGADAVAVTAKSLIDGAGEFTSWLAFGGSATGRVLTVAARSSSLAIAVFGIPQPDPCALLRAQRDGIGPGDFPTIDAYRRALAAANARLHACEKLHGEPVD